MRKTITLTTLILFVISTYAQQGFNYKAIITDNGNVLQNQAIDVKFIITSPANIIQYGETHATTTDDNGIITLTIGEGTSTLQGAFSALDWSQNHTLKVFVDIGNGYENLGATFIKSVPNAKFANKAENLLPTEKIVIGEFNNTHTERLYIYAEDNSDTSELVDFKIHTPTENADILNLNFAEDPATGISQFIECNVGGINKFWVDNNGDIHTQGDLRIKNDINFWFNGEVNADYSGDADMKAYIYGMIGSTGDEVSNACSSGYSSSRIDTGIYRINFTTNFSGGTDYITMANAIDTVAPQIATVKQFFDHVDIYIWNISGDEVDSQFNFVIYKK